MRDSRKLAMNLGNPVSRGEAAADGDPGPPLPPPPLPTSQPAWSVPGEGSQARPGGEASRTLCGGLTLNKGVSSHISPSTAHSELPAGPSCQPLCTPLLHLVPSLPPFRYFRRSSRHGILSETPRSTDRGPYRAQSACFGTACSCVCTFHPAPPRQELGPFLVIAPVSRIEPGTQSSSN